ncbi:type IV secretion system protein (plasmid) [Rhizobium leguminosarum]|jgi:type IV secretion system protein VirB6|uniref:type IV secretion system protein n=1 Tax=Rhizobium TaxID=379 RepID=UPI0003773F3C|nr:type IV secretion system protein [Rhizobium leguminosarum]MBB4332045.1 type IV secretion system protein VirB6 [Rhizobium leguminosarum]MBB4357670.1 type IV secretion system protein VirB6 [Rhizobium leguminosarum]MBB4466627.1 type IV secretion system protein VirB6 [Rhizobium leguminosarum]MBB4473168.1 type IV secretion system protein VirB6 [Rhizobium leguminosarum]MBB4549608.1 type IV secretion system protein VirB6 [Rhizobium leguminosarum]
MYQVFSFVDGQFKSPLENFISSGTSNIASWISGPLTAALTLYVVLYGYLVLRGSVQEPILEFAFRAMKLAIIVMLVRNASEYQTYVTNIFFETLPREISQALNSGTAPSASTFDSLLDKGQKCAKEIWARATWPADIVTGIGGMMAIGASFTVAAIGYIVSLYARLALAIVLAIGPIFVALAMFQSTRRFTESWIGQLVNFVILQVLVVAIGSLLISCIDTTFTAVESYTDVMMRPVALCAICLAALYVFYQLPGIASALAAGGASLTYGYGAARDAHEGTLAWAASHGARAVGRGARSVSRRLRS